MAPTKKDIGVWHSSLIQSALSSSPRARFSTEGKTENNEKAEGENQGEVDAKSKEESKATEDGKAKEEPEKPEAQMKRLQDEVKKKDEQVKDKHDQLLRAYAEIDNVHKMKKQELEKERQMGNQAFALSVLEVADNLGLALDAFSQQVQKDPETAHKTLAEGIRMTDTVLHQILARHNVTKMEVGEGAKFDPYQHEALTEVPVEDDKKHSTVHSVIKPGYKLRERTLRPAKVLVHKKKTNSCSKATTTTNRTAK